MAAILINELGCTTQCPSHLENTLQRVAYDMGEKHAEEGRVQRINTVVAGTQFEGCVEEARKRLAGAQPLLGRPFLRNDDPCFIIAKFPLHDVMYG